MRKLHVFAVGAIGVLVLAACSSDSGGSGGEPLEGEDFYPGEPVGSSGGSAGAAQYPTFEAIEYPAGPYGTDQGSIVENYELLGWKAPASVGYDTNQMDTVRFSDFYDPDGSKGLKAIFLNSSAVWCSVCKAEYAWMKNDGTWGKYNPQGVIFISSLFEDASNPPKPATPLNLMNWGTQYGVEFPMMLDPGFKFGRFFTADATPMNLVIDPRTMRIEAKILGGDILGVLAQVDALVAKNSQ